MGCAGGAAATLTYVHSDATIVIGPLATKSQPGVYDLCAKHSENFTAPRNWHIIRLETGEAEPERSHDDLLAIADAVREAAEPEPPARVPEQRDRPRRHLRVLGGEGR